LSLLIFVLVVLFALILLLKSVYSIGPTQVGMVRKRFGPRLPGGFADARTALQVLSRAA
jgi:hypothetical protein